MMNPYVEKKLKFKISDRYFSKKRDKKVSCAIKMSGMSEYKNNFR